MFINNTKEFFVYKLSGERNTSPGNITCQLQKLLESWFLGDIKGNSF